MKVEFEWQAQAQCSSMWSQTEATFPVSLPGFSAIELSNSQVIEYRSDPELSLNSQCLPEGITHSSSCWHAKPWITTGQRKE